MAGGEEVREAGSRAAAIVERCKKLRIPPAKLKELSSYSQLQQPQKAGASSAWLTPALLVLLAALTYQLQLHSTIGWSRLVFKLDGGDELAEECLVEMPDVLTDLTTAPVDCQLCSDVHQVDRVANITPQEFENRYAYSGRPVVITDGTANWTAPSVFSFTFFRDLYADDSPVMEGEDRGCQFFPYKTKFETLGEVFSMSLSRANMEPGEEPWYIGWSNCDSSAANELRRHYSRPYFLPATAESSRLDWLFMGTPGFGAHMHVDHVRHPSWQAQLRGRKLWTLEPPPECRSTCSRLEVTVMPGEIIVLDTNMWYHMTKIVSDNISITIGSEYD